MREYRLLMLKKLFLTAFLLIACMSVMLVSPAQATPRFTWESEAPGWGGINVLKGVTYGDGLYVAVGGPGQNTSCDIETSPDGITWTVRSCPNDSTDSPLEAVAYGNGTYVAVGGYNHVVTSTDSGATWIPKTIPAIDPHAITYGNNMFVAVGTNTTNTGQITTSQDGVTWTTPIDIYNIDGVPDGTNLYGVTYGYVNGSDMYVAVGHAQYGPSVILTSPDASNWTVRSTPSGIGLYAVAFDASSGFAAVGSGDYYSADGISWVTRGAGTFYGIAHGYDSWVGGGWYNLYSSPDGSSWAAELPQSNAPLSDSIFYAVTFGNNSFVAVGGSGAGGTGPKIYRSVPIPQLTVTKVGGSNVTITSSPSGINCGSTCGYDFSIGTVVTLTAASAPTTWTGCDSSSGSTCIVTMNGPKTVTATFMVTLAVVKPGNGYGTVTSSPGGISCGSTCSYSYNNGQLITLTASANSDSVWGGWGGACSGTGTTCTVTMNGDTQVTATFTLDPVITVVTTGYGTVSSSPAGINSCGDGGGTCSAYFIKNNTVTLTAYPDQNSYFVSWTNCPANPSGSVCGFTVNGNVTITATFVYRPDLAVTIVGSGTVTSSPTGINCSSGTCDAHFDPNTSVTLSAVPAANYYFAGWTGACTGTNTTCTVAMGSTDKQVTATFITDPKLTVIFAPGMTGTGSATSSPAGINCSSGGGTCSYYYAPTASITLTEVPGQNSYFSGWTGAGCSGTGPCYVTMGSSDITVTASFTTDPKLTVNKTGNDGTGTVQSNDLSINCGSTCTQANYYYAPNTTVTLTTTADSGSFFTGWSGAGCSGTSTCTITMTTNTTVTASIDACPDELYRVVGVTGYQRTLADAWANLPAGGGTIQARAGTFTDSLTASTDRPVTLQGGYDCGFNTNTGGMTTIQGAVNITSSGYALSISNFVIQKQ